MSGGLAMRAFKNQEEDEEDKVAAPKGDMPELRQLAQRLADRTPKAETVAAPTPPPAKDALGGYLGAQPAQGGDAPDPNTFVVVKSPTEGVLFKDPKTGKVWTGMELRKLPGHEAKLYEGMSQQKMGK